ncbi:alanine/glycine:cation symporter family protein [Arcanobacterium bovis]|uniref:Alanine:cation symporter family protein n=1 Tax=Arcanobacterium bovis TaxID=2529275 RepID=A0A4Q9V3W7_9ACTO|nr:alanine/glycine:cation symporter family protein [Arcanobacterium bovis]TBW23823.1 alanine:cation symporter family protein [Arcanobacterium bovis]
MDDIAKGIEQVANAITVYGTMWILIGTGLFLTWRTRAVQLRLFRHMVHVVLGSRAGSKDGISSFQAFTISLAARVGIGNVFGVAAALLMGGPGAIFWMWVVALVGMATAFFEAVLAQVFKVDAGDGTFRGGPAYYMRYGMNSKIMGAVFAIITVVTCGVVITSVQSNAIASTLSATAKTSAPVTAVILFVLGAPIIFGGIRSVARVTEIMAPVMALMYIVMAFAIVLINIKQFPHVIGSIINSAFAPEPLVGGLGGGILAAVINGTKRGLFSNEAGQGTAPNAAATATVAHPVSQGLIQSLGVFVDTILVCTATAFIILDAGPEVWMGEGVNPANLTTLAVAHELGNWSIIPMAIMIFVLAFSSIIGAYVYSEVNMFFVTSSKIGTWIVRVASVFSIVLGALVSLNIVWATVDIAMAVMTITNLIALVMLSKWGVAALRDYEKQRKAGISEPQFVASECDGLPQLPAESVWNRKDVLQA